VFANPQVSICRGRGSHLNESPLLAITCQIDLLFPAGPGVAFSRAYGNPKILLVPVGSKRCTGSSGARVRDGPAELLHRVQKSLDSVHFST
jgi:hypothetical protein